MQSPQASVVHHSIQRRHGGLSSDELCPGLRQPRRGSSLPESSSESSPGQPSDLRRPGAPVTRERRQAAGHGRGHRATRFSPGLP
jgi:hypothetical protein